MPLNSTCLRELSFAPSGRCKNCPGHRWSRAGSGERPHFAEVGFRHECSRRSCLREKYVMQIFRLMIAIAWELSVGWRYGL
jgi:hypothetical protein